MKRIRALTAAAAMVTGMIATIPTGPASAGHVSAPYFDLGALPANDFEGDEIFDGLKEFVAAYPYRVTGGPTEILAGQFLYDEMVELGYETSMVTLTGNTPAGNPELCAAGMCTGAGLKAIRAIKRGTTRPDEWVMFVGHYDTLPSTIDGAYDNGAGTNLINYLAKELANVETNRSMVFTWYNAEEEGLLASARDAQQLKAAGQEITAVFGFDMVGIAWPVANPTSQNCLCMFHGPTDGGRFVPLLQHVNYEFLGFPNSVREVYIVGPNSRNSDERSFANQGYPTMRWAGMRTASSYNGYHLPNDTIENIIAVSGGEEFYEAGIENTLKSAYYTALAIDNHAPQASASVDVIGSTATVATTATDEDGPAGPISVDFGDGTVLEGADVQHTYAAPGTYTITVSAADNLHTDITTDIEVVVQAF